jgi:transcriptional regulator with XRE-family HTH domain
MTVATVATSGAGALLRDWRRRRRLSQLDLSLEAAVSARHLSFVETGRSKPSRELLLHLAEHLEIPLRDRNAMLLAGGYAPVYSETSLDDEAMEPVRGALEKLLASHEPYPAVIVDRRWNLVARNEATGVLLAGVSQELLEPPVNVVRLSLHPAGLAPQIINLEQWSEHLLTRLHRQLVLAPDDAVRALYEEASAYPGVAPAAATDTDPAAMLFVPLRLRAPGGGELSFFSTLATFGTALDVTLAELSIEAFYPADRATADALR